MSKNVQLTMNGNLDTVVRIAEEIAEGVGVEFSGALLRPHAFLMNENKEKGEEVLSAVKSAGAQLIREGKISSDTLETISQPLIPEKELREMYNKMYQRAKESSS